MFSLSAFIAKLIPIGGALLQNVNTSPKSKHEENADMSESDSDIEVEEQVSAIDIGKKSRCLLEILMHNCTWSWLCMQLCKIDNVYYIYGRTFCS